MIKKFINLNEADNSVTIHSSAHKDWKSFYQWFMTNQSKIIIDQKVDWPTHYIQFDIDSIKYIKENYKENILYN